MITRLQHIILLCLAFAFSLNTNADTGGTHWWGNYTHTQDIKEHWQLSSRIEMRYYDLDQNLYRAGFSPKIQYQGQKNLKYIAGCRFFYYDTETKDGTMEYRPWLGLSYSHTPYQKIALSHQTRWEHRIFEGNSSAYESRIRYKFKVGTTLYKKDERTLQIAFATELFWSFNDWDDGKYKNTRWAMPVGYRCNKKILLELVPFIQTNHDGIFNISDDQFGVIQLNLKTFL